MSKKQKSTPTPTERIDKIIAAYKDLDQQAHELLDTAAEELRLQCPGVPVGMLKACSFTGKAGTSLDVPAALLILRKRYE